ncbi:unnamed protein product [Rotaria sordida]|uniref:Helitron helicase-like domain-containing protein n=1 Tax=Rotaria sordida TaxID=392033 RepID=A0A815V4Z4_9BILA|nr:unnamed protein product [Rotaria sordida]CAF1528506.1 unnamed protein product [Rotaria sordida]
MWLGDAFSKLQGLIIPEEQLISLYRHNSCTIKLHSPFHSTTIAQTALKGNYITFLQNVPNIVNSLLLTLDDLCDTLKVIFVGAHPPERIQLKKVLTARKKKIIEALRWLKKHNVLYQNVDINLKDIAQLTEDDVPECIMSMIEQKIDDEEIQSERAGYIPDSLSNLIERTTTDSIPISNSGVLDVNGSSVSSNEITDYLLHKIKNDGTKEQMDTESVYLIPHSSKPVDEYFNLKLFVGLYPTLFCYGRGTPEDQSRPVKVNLREHMRYLLSYNDRRFETNHSFIFVVFNLLQRCDACFHVQLIATKPYFRVSADEIQSLKSEDIEIALDNISKKTYSSESSSALNKLLHHIKTIGGRVMGSAYSRTALCTRIHALIYNQGLPSILLTLNPADIHSPVALYFAGVKFDLDNIQMEQLMDNYKRAEIIASHPIATAKYFHLLISNILDTMIVGGVLGPIKAYFGTVESQGRGSLHLHLLIWLDHDMKSADMKDKIQNADFLPRSWNTPPRLSRDNIYAALSTMDLTGLQQNIYGPNNIISTPLKEQFVSSILHVSALPNKLLQTPTRNQSTFVINASYNESKVIPACLPTLNPSLPNFASRFRTDVVQLVEASNIHKLSDTCYKYWNANKVIAEAQVDNDAIDPVLLPAKHDVHGEYDMDDSDDLLELLGNLDEYTTAAVNATRKTTENKYIEETIEAVENVGRFNHTTMHYKSSSDISIDRTNRQLMPVLCATPHLVQLNTK